MKPTFVYQILSQNQHRDINQSYIISKVNQKSTQRKKLHMCRFYRR